MNFELFLPVISQLLGRDVTPYYQALLRARNAIGSALNEQGQIYLTRHWMSVVDFMETPDGREGIKMYLEMWKQWRDDQKAVDITAPDVPPEQPQPPQQATEPEPNKSML